MGGAGPLRAWKVWGAPERWGREPQGAAGRDGGQRQREETDGGASQQGEIMEPPGRQMGVEGTGVRKTKDTTEMRKGPWDRQGPQGSLCGPHQLPPSSPETTPHPHPHGCRGQNRA